MSAPEVGKAVREGISQEYDFIVVNFANGDMVGHTGDYNSAINAEKAKREIEKEAHKEAQKNYYTEKLQKTCKSKTLKWVASFAGCYGELEHYLYLAQMVTSRVL